MRTHKLTDADVEEIRHLASNGWTQSKIAARFGVFSAMQARQTHCKRGHPLSGENVRLYRNTRVCRACKAMRQRRELLGDHGVAL
jgi:hypothetical protein